MAEKYGKKVRELMVKEVKELFENNKGFVFSNFENVSAKNMDGFRKKVCSLGTNYMIIKKTLGQKALKDIGYNGFDAVFAEKKNIGVMPIKDDPVEVAKLLVDFAKQEKNFNVSSGCLEGKEFGADKVIELASLPPREQLLAMVVGTMNAPISGFVRTLGAVIGGAVNVINAIKEKKEKE